MRTGSAQNPSSGLGRRNAESRRLVLVPLVVTRRGERISFPDLLQANSLMTTNRVNEVVAYSLLILSLILLTCDHYILEPC